MAILLVTFDTWEQLINALKYEYTTSLKDVCKMLKISRGSLDTYIRPHVNYVYLNNNIRSEHSKGIDWVRMAALELEKNMTESIWFHTDDLKNYIKSCISSVTKRSKSVPVSFFMTNKKLHDYQYELAEYDRRIMETKNVMARASLYRERCQCYKKYIYKDDATIELFKNQMSVGKRTLASYIPVPLPDVEICDWIAPHDIKNYGDSDETVHRMFFREGYIKIDLKMIDGDGKLGNKVYYVPDPNPIKGDTDKLIFSEEAWQNFLMTHTLSNEYYLQ